MPRTSLTFSADQPLLPQLVEHLLASCTAVPLDLSDVLVIVPTQQAGRRLRQSLAVAAAERGTGVLAPQVATPDQLIAPAPGVAAASSADVLSAWAALLQDLDLDRYRAVFPTDPPRRDASWATGLAQQLSSLQNQLGEHGLDFAAVALRVVGTERESDRWAALSELEQAWKNLLAENDLLVPNEAKLLAVAQNDPHPAITRIILAAVIDPLPLSLQVLERWTELLPVEVVSHGEETLFDSWGRVLPEVAAARTLPLDSRATLRVTRDVKEAAALTASLANEYSSATSSLAIGALDPRCLNALELAFHSRGLSARDLSGVSLASTGLGLLAINLLELVNDVRPAFLAQLLRHPVFAEFATKTKGWATHQAELLVALDCTMNDHLPSDVSALIAFAEEDAAEPTGSTQRLKVSADLASALHWLAHLHDEFKKRSVGQTLRAALSSMVGKREFAFSEAEDSSRAEELEQLGDILDGFVEVEGRFPTLSNEATAAVLRRMIQNARRFPTHPSNGWDLQGWLELPYEDAPHLVLVGLNEGSVPETITGDSFLPNSLREFLGLRSNTERFRRDQILLENHLRSRAGAGRVDLIVPRMSDNGDPLQPSRMLFCCSDDDLVARAKQLFAELPPPRATPPRRAAWKLQPLPAEAPKSFSPSKLKAYLACPYRYYLKHILKMEAVEVGKHELSAASFGDFLHRALETLGKDAAMRDALNSDEIAAYLAQALEEITRRQLGTVDTFALQVQLESGRARLAAAAEVEARERAEGWRIEQSEEPWTLTLGEMVINGRIDRIDRNLKTGAYRLIDYKTNDRGKPPEEAHWVKHKPADLHALPEAIFEMYGDQWRWVDLQLPLYLLAMREKYGTDVSAGYFVLPKTKEGTGIRLWTELTPEHLIQAEACARAIGAAVANRRFWPPAELRYEDEADYLFPDGLEANVDAEEMVKLSNGGGGS